MKAMFRVHGRVQGVGFRYHVLRVAQELGLGGWVRNDPEGTVSGEAVGDGPRLEALRDFLAEGPAHARVSRLDWNASDGGESLPPDMNEGGPSAHSVRSPSPLDLPRAGTGLSPAPAPTFEIRS